ncbi:hypothetical protein SAMN04488074_112178 [Lentzea albidocapillata subsp. violacea]|uniref:Deazaflavin-dependent oxidoreductase, nitroreductase family n=1 Tax=Lentzea albidocapillata subsp. violacea TaxID=128104 RepID=A0A1G9LTC6_9PSEU|nr:hypothetical protein [Lentzea albidocapillata]SDL65236.1 hypothetical protein SAMN04488074_112178 [Lentzea albidocapillata subsp. violacea]
MTVIGKRPPAPDQRAVNDRMRMMLAVGDPVLARTHLALLHFTGRRSGRHYVVPAGVHEIGDRLVVATSARWRHNFTGALSGAVTWRGAHTPATFELVESAAEVADGYLKLITSLGPEGTERKLGLIVPADRPVTLADAAAAVTSHGLALIGITLKPAHHIRKGQPA